ncbi:MAG TPA: tRNA preQ1(34) S-adenosylmethionine ribosyltransferase-isomerase QueA [Synergistaceae bacterium]|nr:tRNA preQ1(34) S-adenosylmethionine ribosyltransferase-isomerase QueA [Synergistaceae bacterium]
MPEELIAQNPAEPRDASRLLVVPREGGELGHRRFSDLPTLLCPGDLLVLNDTRVWHARLLGAKPSGARVELLLLRPLDAEETLWEALVRPGRRLNPGAEVIIPGGRGVVGERRGEGLREVRFELTSGTVREVLAAEGRVPLPPYIRSTEAPPGRYQTVYARQEGSAAAPTAGLHFTEGLLERLEERGVEISFVTLHVGLGTFRPVESDDVRRHVMHEERCFLPEGTADAVARARARGGRVVAVGTTVVRTLETFASDDGTLRPGTADTGLFITPGFRFRAVDALVTNFHLPRSTLLMLVSAFAGYDRVMGAYRKAVEDRYRFFSFGDAMFIA